MEEKKEIITEVVQKDPKEDMKNNFRKFRKIIQAFEIFLIIIPIILAIFGAIIGIQIVQSSAEQEATNESYSIVEETNVEVEEITTANIVKSVIYVIIVIIDYVLIIVVLDNVKKIFANIENSGDPFMKENIKHIDRISIMSVVLGIIKVIATFFDGTDLGIGLIFLIVILAISYVYRYGCELQEKVES